MNMIAKTGVAGALALSATGAFALGIPSTNSSDLVLVVQSVATPTDVYMLDTSISLNTIFPSGSFVSNASLSTALAGISTSIAESSTLKAFLTANPASGDVWTLQGAQYAATFTGQTAVNADTKTAGSAKYVFSSIQPTTNIAGLGLGALQGMLNLEQGDVTAGGFQPLQTSLENDTTVAYSSQDQEKGVFDGVDMASLGSTAIPIYALTGNNGTGTPQSYILGSATLSSAGVLSITGNAKPVPLPAAVWLFGSGVLGLIGVSRRRKAVVEAA